MSLTSHIANKHSPIHQFFAELIPLAASRKAVRELNTEARSNTPWGGPLVVEGTVPTLAGAAFDYGFRHWITPFGPQHPPGVAIKGAHLAGANGWPDAPRLLVAIAMALPTLDGTKQARCFVAMAAIERFYRAFHAVLAHSGDAGDDLASQLLVDPPASLDALLARMPDATARDVAALLATVQTRWAFLQGQPFISNPTFPLSAALGGADADWVLDGILYECKVCYQANPVERKHVLQLLGYLLADTDDALGIEAVCLMLPRQIALVRYSVPRFLRSLGIEEELPTLCARFAAVVANLPPMIVRRSSRPAGEG
jgi:hypothetical protein